MSIRAARDRFHALVGEISAGGHVLICRRSAPLAVLVSAADYDQMAEAVRRDEGLAAVMRGRGVSVEPWTTPKVLEAVARLLEEKDA